MSNKRSTVGDAQTEATNRIERMMRNTQAKGGAKQHNAKQDLSMKSLTNITTQRIL